MNTLRLRARDVEALVWKGGSNLPPTPRPDKNRLLAFRLDGFARAAARRITVSLTVLTVHFAVLKYIFLAT